ncbi:protein PHR1-LIKE 3 isoform X1 [Helianthus annuus]|uniref:protein PHR1-LIKE 3 isoform X1 n=1 Tax=Helianthus annuus TaxID=4232 RepID=UPI000B905D06|nr:protein PHR1-LIKE 3 isoform X1 [Helianthus annuus]XP_022011952.1 protein PHR1-LIKE 3 isoform X1 [Helianthus annuus]XP_022011953.1 protein PHR1-LIKE 3 isoform X1 [Helianthus annuus]
MYSGIHSIMPLEDFPRPNLVGDPCLVLTTDPKPRLRWTAEFHERFVDAVTQLGGPDKATPKMIMRTMGVKGLTLYHLKSHLQKYRMGKQSCKEFSDNSKEVSCIAESQDMGSSTSSSTRMMPQDLNDGFEVIEALRVQMEIQRILHEQLEFFVLVIHDGHFNLVVLDMKKKLLELWDTIMEGKESMANELLAVGLEDIFGWERGLRSPREAIPSGTQLKRDAILLFEY